MFVPKSFLCRLQSIAAHRDHLVWRLSVRLSVSPSVCLSGSPTFLVVTHSYVSQATHAFLAMLPLCFTYREVPELNPSNYGLSVAESSQRIPMAGLYSGSTDPLTLPELLDKLNSTYCGHAAVELDHVEVLSVITTTYDR